MRRSDLIRALRKFPRDTEVYIEGSKKIDFQIKENSNRASFECKYQLRLVGVNKVNKE